MNSKSVQCVYLGLFLLPYVDDVYLIYLQGTFYFFAMALLQGKHIMKMDNTVIHSVHHDLESFYWVLLWIVLRHTKHNIVVQDPCQVAFEYGDDQAARNAKRGWIMDYDDKLKVLHNEPLTTLLEEFRQLIERCAILAPKVSPDQHQHLTHAKVLKIFDDALKRTDWPDKSTDGAIPYKGPAATGGSNIATTKTKNLKRRMKSRNLDNVDEEDGTRSKRIRTEPSDANQDWTPIARPTPERSADIQRSRELRMRSQPVPLRFERMYGRRRQPMPAPEEEAAEPSVDARPVGAKVEKKKLPSFSDRICVIM